MSKTLLLGIVAGLQLGIGSAMTVSTLAGLSGIQAQNPALAKIVAGLVGLPCGLLMVSFCPGLNAPAGPCESMHTHTLACRRPAHTIDGPAHTQPIQTAVSGVELFTGNTALVGMAFLERQATTKQLAKNWVVSYLGNILGTALLAFLCQRALVFGPAISSGITAIAVAKASLPFSVVRCITIHATIIVS